MKKAIHICFLAVTAFIEVASSNKSLSFNITTTMAWSYSSYDEALASR